MMQKIVALLSNHKYLALALAGVSLAILAFAYVSQYVFHYDPCILCLYQRKPYFAVTAVSLLAFLLHDKNPRWAFYLLLLSGAAFLAGAGIAGFHTGVEQDWWKGLQSCGDANLPQNATVEQLKEYLHNKKITRCDVPSWKFLGLSMTNYNFAQSLLLAAGTFYFAFRGRK